MTTGRDDLLNDNQLEIAKKKFQHFVPTFEKKLNGLKPKGSKPNKEPKLDKEIMLLVFCIGNSQKVIPIQKFKGYPKILKLKLGIDLYFKNNPHLKELKEKYDNLNKKQKKPSPQEQLDFLKLLLLMHFLRQKFEYLPEEEQANILAFNSNEIGYEISGMGTRETDYQVFREPEFLKSQFAPEKLYNDLASKGVIENPDNNPIVGFEVEHAAERRPSTAFNPFDTSIPNKNVPPGAEG